MDRHGQRLRARSPRCCSRSPPTSAARTCARPSGAGRSSSSLAWLAVRFLLLRAGADAAPGRHALDPQPARLRRRRARRARRPRRRRARRGRPRAGGPQPARRGCCSPASRSRARSPTAWWGWRSCVAWWVHERRGFVRRTAPFVLAARGRRRAAARVGRTARLRPARPGPPVDLARHPVAAALRGAERPAHLRPRAHPGHLAGGRARRSCFVVLLARLTRGLAPETATGAAARWALVLSAAYTLAAPYSLPWYDLLTWATLPVLAASVLDTILLVRLAAMAVAYVPGRVVGMTPTVERVIAVGAPHPGAVCRAAGLGVAHPRRDARVVADPRASSSSTLTLTAMISGTAMIAPLAGIATPESLMAKPMVSVTSRAIRPGRRVGTRLVGPLQRPRPPRRRPGQDVDDEDQRDRHEQRQPVVAEEDVDVLLELADDDVAPRRRRRSTGRTAPGGTGSRCPAASRGSRRAGTARRSRAARMAPRFHVIRMPRMASTR